MTSKPNRYQLVLEGATGFIRMDEHERGNWVHWQDYERLRAALQKIDSEILLDKYAYRRIAAAALSGDYYAPETPAQREDREYVEGLEKRILDLVKGGEVILGLLDDAMERMTRARMILTDDNPRPNCNWGMLDVSDIKKRLLEGPSAQETSRDELYEVVREVSTMDCFYSGTTCAPDCTCIVARATKATLQPTQKASVTDATSLLHAHWEKLGAELPDVYEYLRLVTVSEGRPFEWPGMRLIPKASAKPCDCNRQSAIDCSRGTQDSVCKCVCHPENSAGMEP